MSGDAPAKGTGFIAWYNAVNAEHPLASIMVKTSIIVGIGDVLCQVFVEKKEAKNVDKTRTARMCFLGFALLGPTLFHWYGFLYRAMPGTGIAAVVKRVAADQLLFAPAFMVVFFTSLFALEGRIDDLVPHLKANYVDALKVNWMMWIPAQALNFSVIPPVHAVMFANFVALFWNTYLSWNGHQDQEAKAGVKAEVKAVTEE